eukprot:Seg1296.3 transcript_id=Seg1296.3/GoldUCD/mRNA.D3Y31 product="UDP-glucuronosyltransferase 3A2" protein_id=Seg1296.3/GoldUCD/D3Y31
MLLVENMNAHKFLNGFLFVSFIMILQTNAVDSKQSKIVFLPAPIISSQYFVVLRVAEEMASRNHMEREFWFDHVSLLSEVSILTTNMIRKRKSSVKHIEYKVPMEEAQVYALLGKCSTGTKRAGLSAYLSGIGVLMNAMLKSCQSLVGNEETLNELKNADMIVSLSMFFCGSYIADIFDKPFVLVHPAGLPVIGAYAQVPMPPSYVPLIGSGSTDEMTFMQRTRNFVVSNIKNIALDVIVSYYFKTFQREMASKSIKSYSQLFGKAELYILPTMDFSFEYAHPLMPSRFSAFCQYIPCYLFYAMKQ